MRILISGGGTGGHIYPALAVAKALQSAYNAEILYLGDERGLETELVPKAGLAFVSIRAGKLRRYLSVKTFTDLGRTPVGFAQAMGHVPDNLKQEQPCPMGQGMIEGKAKGPTDQFVQSRDNKNRFD